MKTFHVASESPSPTGGSRTFYLVRPCGRDLGCNGSICADRGGVDLPSLGTVAYSYYDLDSSAFIVRYDGGAKCSRGGNWSADIFFKCDNDLEVGKRFGLVIN